MDKDRYTLPPLSQTIKSTFLKKNVQEHCCFSALSRRRRQLHLHSSILFPDLESFVKQSLLDLLRIFIDSRMDRDHFRLSRRQPEWPFTCQYKQLQSHINSFLPFRKCKHNECWQSFHYSAKTVRENSMSTPVIPLHLTSKALGENSSESLNGSKYSTMDHHGLVLISLLTAIHSLITLILYDYPHS